MTGRGASVRDRAIEYGYGAAWKIVRALPRSTSQALFRTFADRTWRRNGAGVAQLAENLRVVVGPDLPDDEFALLVRDAVRSYARYWCDAFLLPKLTPEQVLTEIGLDREDVLVENFAAGRGQILCLSHSGNWDLAGAWITAHGMPLTTVAERLKPEGLYEKFLEFRRGLGMEILPLTGGDGSIIDALEDRIRTKHAVVPLLADRDFSRRGVPVTIFGRRTRMPGGPAILAIRTGAPMYAIGIWYEPDGTAYASLTPIEVAGPDEGTLAHRVAITTQRMAEALAADIAQHPADWHMMARMFLPDVKPPAPKTPDADATEVAAGAGP